MDIVIREYRRETTGVDAGACDHPEHVARMELYDPRAADVRRLRVDTTRGDRRRKDRRLDRCAV